MVIIKKYDEALLKIGVLSISVRANKNFEELLSTAKENYIARLNMGFSHKTALRPAIRDLVGNNDSLYKEATSVMSKTCGPLLWVKCHTVGR